VFNHPHAELVSKAFLWGQGEGSLIKGVAIPNSSECHWLISCFVDSPSTTSARLQSVTLPCSKAGEVYL